MLLEILLIFFLSIGVKFTLFDYDKTVFIRRLLLRLYNSNNPLRFYGELALCPYCQIFEIQFILYLILKILDNYFPDLYFVIFYILSFNSLSWIFTLIYVSVIQNIINNND